MTIGVFFMAMCVAAGKDFTMDDEPIYEENTANF
jgi:hypothetical protein